MKRVRIIGALLIVGAFLATSATSASADSYVPISGAGSTWSENALSQWIRDVSQYGMRINFAGTGSSDGRRQFLNGTVDFAASDIPFQSHPTDGSAPENPVAGSYAYMPITAGGTVFMYNLTINGQRVTNLRLSGENITKIFTHAITNWNDPAIAADNPGLRLPNRAIVPVVRSDGAAASFNLSEWMISQYGPLWTDFCNRSGRAPACGPTSLYPTVPGVIAQAGDLGIAGYIAQNYADGAIGYVNYSYALNAHFPVVKMLNAAGYYTEPTAQNVAVSLLAAQIDTTSTDPSEYLTQKLDKVWTDPDPRTYPLSSYGYLILPIKVQGQFTTAKGKTLGAFAYYAMCQGQQESASLGYSPMPINLVQASFTQIARIPGAVVQNINIRSCNNPTFSPDGTNVLVSTAPYPPACDKKGNTECTTGTGGAAASTPTAAGSRAAANSARIGVGAGGTKTASSSGSGGAASGGTAAAGAANCDPTSGSCSGSANANQTDAALAASPTVVGAGSGWGSTQALMLLALALLVALIVVPGVLARRWRREAPS